MAEMSLEDVYQAARRLLPDEQEELIERLQAARTGSRQVTRTEILEEFERRRAAGEFERADSLRGAFAAAQKLDKTDDELRREIREDSAQWKRDMDEA